MFNQQVTRYSGEYRVAGDILLTSGLYSSVGTRCCIKASIDPAISIPSANIKAWNQKIQLRHEYQISRWLLSTETRYVCINWFSAKEL